MYFVLVKLVFNIICVFTFLLTFSHLIWNSNYSFLLLLKEKRSKQTLDSNVYVLMNSGIFHDQLKPNSYCYYFD